MLVLELVGEKMAPYVLWARKTEGGGGEGDYSSLIKNYVHVSCITYMTQNPQIHPPCFYTKLAMYITV